MKSIFPSTINDSIDDIFKCMSCGFIPTYITKKLFNELLSKYEEKLLYSITLGECIDEENDVYKVIVLS